MKIVFKLYATLQDYLPAEAKKTNTLTLDLNAGTTIQQIVERFARPQQLCHLVLVDGLFVPPGARAARYKSDKNASKNLTTAVMAGTSLCNRHWKDESSGAAMPPNGVAISEADAKRLVAWILTLDK